MLQARSITDSEQMAQNRALEAVAGHTSGSDGPTRLDPIPQRKGQRLDVDEILTRSLPKVASPQTVSATILSLGRRSSAGGKDNE